MDLSYYSTMLQKKNGDIARSPLFLRFQYIFEAEERELLKDLRR